MAAGFSGEVALVPAGLATLPLEDCPLTLLDDCPLTLLLEAGDWEAFCDALPATPPTFDCAPLSAAGLCEETPDPRDDDGEALHVSAMCFALVTVKVLPAEEDDCVWPVLLAAAEDVESLPEVVPLSWTWCPTCCFRSEVAPFSW